MQLYTGGIKNKKLKQMHSQFQKMEGNLYAHYHGFTLVLPFELKNIICEYR